MQLEERQSMYQQANSYLVKEEKENIAEGLVNITANVKFSGSYKGSIRVGMYAQPQWITVINANYKVTIKDNRTKASHILLQGLNILYGDYTIHMPDNVQILLISPDFYDSISIPKFNYGLVKHVHGRLIEDLLERTKISIKPQYELLAIAHLIGVDQYDIVVDGKFDKVMKIIRDKASDPNFNLDMLCSLSHMSRRKVQYVLSEKGHSFLELTNKIRVRNLKETLTIEPNLTLTLALNQAGFSSYSNAARVFKNTYGMTITEFLTSQ
ncbi:AraC family transcriptional regulator [Vibrio alfacsensis]|uniref:AraC family transcriptional regulator n=1 Tax=Vibrio alfacsensis TaxID=1074311 RepID=UPI001BF03390|nr:AraC family transcriptional regulator [Vibrio alfacsensis]WQE75081.1 AraC family transcriptional regulator [Vibrio alfacsensis]BCN24304.1 hypothetical protein VYA_14960 [Vibrio alfacsensis]